MALIPVEDGQEQAQGESGVIDYAKRQAGLVTRAAINPATVGMAAGAVAGIPAGPGGVAIGGRTGAAAGLLTDIGAKVYNALIAETTGAPSAPVLSDVLDKIKTDIGLPRPEGAIEKMQERAIEGITSLVPITAGGRVLEAAAKSPVLKEIGKALYRSPTTQYISAGVGGLASGLAEDAGAGAAGQAAAGLAGAIVPGSISRMASVAKKGSEFGLNKIIAGISGLAGITETTRAAAVRLLRGGKTPEQISRNIAQFEAAGTIPSAGQATGSPYIQQAETTMGRFPSAFVRMREKGLSQQEEIGRRIEEIRAGISKVREPEIAGRKMGAGFENIFVPKARQIQKNLYNTADSLFPQNRVNLNNTISKLDDIANRFEQSPELQQVLGNRQIMSIRDAIIKSRNEEGMVPFQTLRDLRTTVGEKLSNVDLTPDVSRAEYKALYKALTQDLDSAVAPYEKARNAYSRANNYTRAFHDRMDRVQNILTKANGEDVYSAVISGAKDGPSKLRAVLRSVPRDDQKALVSTFVARMGRAAPSLQDETGEVFSTSRFLTNYSALDPAARSELFGRFGKEFLDDMKNIASVSAKIRESSQILANPSGTAGAVVGPATVASVGGSIAAGKFGFAAGMLEVLLGANQAARLFTNPKYVRWLSSNIEKPVSSAGAALATLSNIAERENDPDIREFVDEVKSQSTGGE